MDSNNLNALGDDSSWLTAPVEQPLHTETLAEYETRKSQYFAKIVAKYPTDSVVIGSCVEAWEDYQNTRVCAVIEYPVETPEFKGVGKVECHLALNSTIEVLQASQGIYENRVLVINKTSKQILGAFAPIY